jgi:AbrB family looped-hinge helix DNA binding protein
MSTTKLSSKGQIVLPKSVRDARHWPPGTEFSIQEVSEGVLLKPVPSVKRTELSDVFGMLRYKGPAKTLEEMERAAEKGVRERRDSGRY